MILLLWLSRRHPSNLSGLREKQCFLQRSADVLRPQFRVERWRLDLKRQALLELVMCLAWCVPSGEAERDGSDHEVLWILRHEDALELGGVHDIALRLELVRNERR